VAALSRGLELLESAVGYAVASAGLVTPQLLSGSTPCSGWDVGTLLAHLSGSIAVLRQSLVVPHPAPPHPAPPHPAPHPQPAPQPDPQPGRGDDPVAELRRQAARLVGGCAAAGRAEHQAAAVGGGRALSAGIVAATGALEISVHGWDVAAACGAPRPVPPGLAVVLLPVAQLLVPPGIRPGLFASPVRVSAPACPGDQLVAFLGRQPR
jgi:uncharacterized protein (TIGR03086 family)